MNQALLSHAATAQRTVDAARKSGWLCPDCGIMFHDFAALEYHAHSLREDLAAAKVDLIGIVHNPHMGERGTGLNMVIVAGEPEEQ